MHLTRLFHCGIEYIEGEGMDLLGSILNSMEAPPDDKEGKKARMSKCNPSCTLVTRERDHYRGETSCREVSRTNEKGEGEV